MSKENKKSNGSEKNRKSNIVATITNSLNKHGEIKGENKKETKNLKNMCPHHKITKKGKIKPTIINDGTGVCTCEMCGHKFPTKLFSKEDIDKIFGKTTAVLDQTRFMIQAADLGKDTENYTAKLSVDLAHFPKVYGKVRHVVERSENTKKKKKKGNGGGNNYGSESMGGWR